MEQAHGQDSSLEGEQEGAQRAPAAATSSNEHHVLLQNLLLEVTPANKDSLEKTRARLAKAPQQCHALRFGG